METKTTDGPIRKNVSLQQATIDAGERLVISLHKSSFSQLLTDLIWEAERRQPKSRIQSSTATRKPFDERVAEASAELMEDFKGYMARCIQDNPKTGGKSAMFESWALQRLASLVVRGLELEERITDLEGSSRR